MGDSVPGFFYKEQLVVTEKPKDSDYFFVEKILKTKTINKQKYYFCRFLYYSDKFNLWLPAANFQQKPKWLTEAMLSIVVSKSIVLKANLQSEKLVYRPIEDEFQRRLSYIAISGVSYKYASHVNSALAISCNHVTARKFNNEQKRIENYEVPLTTFQVKSSNSTDNLTVQRITPVWFNINTLSENLEFSFRNIETDQPFVALGECLVMVTVVFKWN